MWDLVSQPGIEPLSSAFQSGFLTTGSPGKSQELYFKICCILMMTNEQLNWLTDWWRFSSVAQLCLTLPSIHWSSLKLMSIGSVMPSNHLIFCRPLLLLPSILPSIRVFFQWVSSERQKALLLPEDCQYRAALGIASGERITASWNYSRQLIEGKPGVASKVSWASYRLFWKILQTKEEEAVLDIWDLGPLVVGCMSYNPEC